MCVPFEQRWQLAARLAMVRKGVRMWEPILLLDSVRHFGHWAMRLILPTRHLASQVVHACLNSAFESSSGGWWQGKACTLHRRSLGPVPSTLRRHTIRCHLTECNKPGTGSRSASVRRPARQRSKLVTVSSNVSLDHTVLCPGFRRSKAANLCETVATCSWRSGAMVFVLGIEGSANKVGVGIVKDDGSVLSNPRHTCGFCKAGLLLAFCRS